MGNVRLAESDLQRFAARLAAEQAELDRRYPGPGARQPLHTVYGGAHLFRADTTRKLGAAALQALESYAPTPASFADALGIPAALAAQVRARVEAKLRREPVEDYRIDFEDGYGVRPDAEEDGHAGEAARACAAALRASALPPFCGIRIKALSGESGGRALRTLDLFLGALLRETQGALPAGFVVTLPKVTSAEQVAVLADACDLLEPALGLGRLALSVELMVETPQALVAPDGRAALPGLVAAARGRCVAAHFGAYDYTAALDVAAPGQRLRHPACDFARESMKVALAGTGLRLSDGATAVLPIAPHRAPAGTALTAAQEAENAAAVRAAWRLHASDVRHALENGFYQGWDLHPGQLPSRYGTAYAFFLEALPAMADRLRNFVGKAAQATRSGGVFDDAATGQGLLNFFLRGSACGALTEEETLASGLSLAELRTRSFAAIVAGRARA